MYFLRIIILLTFYLLPLSPLFSETENKPLLSRLKESIQIEKNHENRVGYIIIDDRTNGINQSTWIYVKNAMDYYKKNKPTFIILELNTPGGEIFSAQNISDALKEMDIQYNVPIVCYINNWAISAGAMLAYSCRFIAYTKDASMGASEPVIMDGTLEPKEASEKVNSAMRSDMAGRARFFDRNPLIAEAMVDKSMILVMRNQEFLKLDSENEIIKTGVDKDLVVSEKGKLLTLNSEELEKYHVGDIFVPPVKTEVMKDRGLNDSQKLKNKPALFYVPFFNEIPNVKIDAYEPDWKTSFFMFLANPIVSSALFFIMMIGFYMEFNMPGATFPLTLALTALFLMGLSSYSLEIGSVLELILITCGILMILLELFVLPSFGFFLIFGIIFFFVGLFGLIIPGIHDLSFDFDTQTLNAAGDLFFERLALLAQAFVAAIITMIVMQRFIFKRVSFFDKFQLKGHEQTNYLAVESQKDLPKIGSKGFVFATLRPGGKVNIDGKIFDAIAIDRYLEKGKKIEVCGYETGNLIVKGVIE